MLDGNNGRHAVSHFRPVEVLVLVFENSKLPGIGIDDLGEGGLEARDVGSAFGIVDIVAETEDILVELVHELEGNLHLDALALSREVDHLMKDLGGLVQVLHEAPDSLRLMEFLYVRLFPSEVPIFYSQVRIQIGCLMETGLDLVLLETGLFKDFRIRKEVDFRPRGL